MSDYSNHISVMNDAIGHEIAGKARSALRLAGYVIYKGDPSDEIASLRAQLAIAGEHIAEMTDQLASARKALRTSLTAMTLASGFEVISIEFEFRHAIAEVRAALTDDTGKS